jgi:branched-chain amino acid transport system substrate-binding protein
MKNRKKLTIALSLTLVVLFAFTGTGQAGETYKLGLSLAITGPTSDAGQPLFERALKTISAMSTTTKILGDDKMDCTIRDDQYKPMSPNAISKIFWIRASFFISTTPPAAPWP